MPGHQKGDCIGIRFKRKSCLGDLIHRKAVIGTDTYSNLVKMSQFMQQNRCEHRILQSAIDLDPVGIRQKKTAFQKQGRR